MRSYQGESLLTPNYKQNENKEHAKSVDKQMSHEQLMAKIVKIEQKRSNLESFYENNIK